MCEANRKRGFFILASLLQEGIDNFVSSKIIPADGYRAPSKRQRWLMARTKKPGGGRVVTLDTLPTQKGVGVRVLRPTQVPHAIGCLVPKGVPAACPSPTPLWSAAAAGAAHGPTPLDCRQEPSCVPAGRWPVVASPSWLFNHPFFGGGILGSRSNPWQDDLLFVHAELVIKPVLAGLLACRFFFESAKLAATNCSGTWQVAPP